MNIFQGKSTCLARLGAVCRPRPRNNPAHALSPEVLGVGLFLTPGMLALVYSAIKGKGNVKDGFSHLVTVLSQGAAVAGACQVLPDALGLGSSHHCQLTTTLAPQIRNPCPAGYLQPDAGGKFLPEAEGDLSEFTGSYITFLYDQ